MSRRVSDDELAAALADSPFERGLREAEEASEIQRRPTKKLKKLELRLLVEVLENVAKRVKP